MDEKEQHKEQENSDEREMLVEENSGAAPQKEQKKEPPKTVSSTSPWAPGSKVSARKRTTQDPEMTIPLGVPLAYTLLCGSGIVLLLMGALISNLTVQTELAPDPILYQDGVDDEQYILDLKDYRLGFEDSREGLRNAKMIFNLGVFSLCLGFVGGAFFAPELRWEMRGILVLTAGIIIGLGAFQL